MSLPKLPEPPAYLAKSTPRQSLLALQEWGFLATDIAFMEFRDFSRYAQAIEELINNQEKVEIESLDDQARSLSEEERGELLMWHYPHHWDDVVRALFRASLISSLVSFLEPTLNQICKEVRILVGEKLSYQDLDKKSAIKRSRQYLERFGGFGAPKDNLWQKVHNIVKIRNALVHANGEIELCKMPQDLRRIIKQSQGLVEANSRIIVEKQYLDRSLEVTGSLLEFLSAEMRSLCDRCRQIDTENCF